MTPAEAADFLRVSVRTLRRYEKTGVVVPCRIGANGPVRYRPEDLKRALVQQPPIVDESISDFIRKQVG